MRENNSDTLNGETLGIKWSVSRAVIESLSEDGVDAMAEIESAIHKHTEEFNKVKRESNDQQD